MKKSIFCESWREQTVLCSCESCKLFHPFTDADVDDMLGYYIGGGGCDGRGVQFPDDVRTPFRECYEERR